MAIYNHSAATGVSTLELNEDEVMHIWEALGGAYLTQMKSNRDHNSKHAVDEEQADNVRRCFAESAVRWRKNIAQVEALIEVLD
jgi:hypothetical protein